MARLTLGFDRNQAIPEKDKALLLDGTALFQASKSLYPENSLDYQTLKFILGMEAGWPESDSAAEDSVRSVMWTSAVEDNLGQAKFLDFVETKLYWKVRKFRPADSYMVDLSSNAALGGNPHASQRLMRFDAPIAFAMGRLAESHQIMLVTDSFTLADPLLRAIEISGQKAHLAFFGRALDSRWLRVIRSTPELNFIDLDDFSEVLFGVSAHPASESFPKEKSLIF